MIYLSFPLTFALISTLVVHRQGLSIWWDYYNYEYSGGFIFRQGLRSAFALPGQYQTYITPHLNWIYYFLENSLGSRKQEVLIAVLESLTLTFVSWTTFAICQIQKLSKAHSMIIAYFSGFLVLLNPLFRTELGATMSDTVVAGVLILGCALFARAFLLDSSEVHGPSIIAGGILLGLSTDLKLTSGFYVLSALLALACALLCRVKDIGIYKTAKKWALAVSTTLAAFTIAYSMQAFQLWEKYRNPLFPYFNGIFRSPYQLTTNLSDQRFTVHDLSHYARNIAGLVTGTTNIQDGGILIRYPSVVVATVIAIALVIENFTRRRDGFLMFIELMGVTSFFVWTRELVLLRYGAPLILGISLIWITSSVYRFGSKGGKLVASLCILALLSLFNCGGAAVIHDKSLVAHFSVDDQKLQQSRHNIVLVGGGALGFIYPYLPRNSEVVRIGGNLQVTMSQLYWERVRTFVLSRRGGWTAFLEASDHDLSIQDFFPGRVLTSCVVAASWRHHEVMKCNISEDE